MAAKAQANCYPSQGLVTQNHTQKPVCTNCNAANPFVGTDCCTSTAGTNSTTNPAACSSYCNSVCNTVCNTVQAYCSIGVQYIRSHGDVGAHPAISCTAKDEFIFRNWTATYWNSLIDKIDTAEQVGKTVKQGAGTTATRAAADPQNVTHVANSLVTAQKYNQQAQKISRFNVTVAQVNKDDVIRGAQAKALVDQYNNARFNTNVCDVCNASGQTNPTCNCDCPCACSCSCGCACTCSGCSCNCSCNCTRA